MVFIKYVLLLLTVCVVNALNAQEKGILEGCIYHNDDPAPNATVQLKKEGKYLLSDSSGCFQFSDLPLGRYVLLVTSAGMEPFQQAFELKSGERRQLRIQMQIATSSLDEVVVTGTLKPVQKLNSPVAVEVYTPQFFKKNPSPSVFESLQMVNGVRPQINCSVCNTGDIHINGLEGPYTMVTIDGMPIMSSLASVYGLFGIPNQLIEKVEIIKGPASGLYGSEAIGGLINIITKNPAKAPAFSMNAMSTSWFEHNIDLGFKKRWGKANSLLGLHYFNYNKPRDLNDDAFTDVTLQHRISLFNKWSFERRENRLATLAGRFFYEDRWGGDMRWKPQYRGGDSIYGESIYTRRWELLGNYQLPVKEKMFFSFSATAHHQNSYYGQTPYMGDQRIFFGQLLWNKAISAKHSILTGATGRYNYYDDNSTATMDTLSKRNMAARYFIPGIFVQNEFDLGENHQILLGLRYDYHPAHHSIVTPRVAYKLRINAQQSLRLNAGTGFRVVNLFTEDHAALTGARAVEIRSQLNPETSYNINANYTVQFGRASRLFTADASAWFTYFHNQIIADYDTDPLKIIYDNLSGYATSKGISLNLEMNIMQRLKGTTGITLQDVSTVNEINGKAERKRPVLTEQVSGTWALSYLLPISGLTFDYTGNVYGPMRLPVLSETDPRKEFSPWWSVQNIQITKWLSPQVEVYGGVKNLLDWTPAKNNPFLIARSHDPFNKKVEYDNSGNVLQTSENPYGLTFDPSYIYAPIQGRRYFAGIRYTLK